MKKQYKYNYIFYCKCGNTKTRYSPQCRKCFLKTASKLLGKYAQKGVRAWNKGKRMDELRGENHYKWKGVNVRYRGLHSWIQRTLGKPNECKMCGLKDKNGRRFHWANISRKYKRELDDWIRLCVKCHKKYDKDYKLKN